MIHRTTKYLAHEGFLEFLNWFDDRGWYPLGRTIGGTIYPGLMLTAAIFYWASNLINFTINIRNVCVFIAPIFSANAAISSYLLTYEVTKRSSTETVVPKILVEKLVGIRELPRYYFLDTKLECS